MIGTAGAAGCGSGNNFEYWRNENGTYSGHHIFSNRDHRCRDCVVSGFIISGGQMKTLEQILRGMLRCNYCGGWYNSDKRKGGYCSEACYRNAAS